MCYIVIGMSNKEYRPTLAQLRTFVTIAENKHFGTAAAKLAISQPSLSQALVALETGLGVQLIERSTRRVIVTPSGDALLTYAKATLDAAEAFLSYARGANGNLSGPLTIGMIPTIAPYILPNLLHLINAELPELEPRIVEDQTKHLLEQLRDGHIDLAVLAVPTDQPGLIEIPLYTEDFVVVVPHDHKLAGRDDLTIDALRGLNLLLLDDGHCLRDQVVDLCRSADFTPDNRNTAVTRAASLATVTQCVSGGLGSTLIPLSAVAAECQRDSLAIAQFNPAVNASRTIGLVYRGSTSRTDEFATFGTLITRAYQDSIADVVKPATLAS